MSKQSGSDAPIDPSDNPIVSVPIDEVMVLEDRAVVTRRGTVRVDPGTHVVRIDGVSACLLDKTLTARGPDGAEVSVTRAEVQRAWATDEASQPDRIKALFERVRTQERLAEAAHARVERAREEAAALAKTEQLALEEIADDVALGRMPPKRGLLDPVRERLDEVRAAKLRARDDITRAEEDLADLRVTMGQLAGHVRAVVAYLRVELHNPSAQTIELPLTVRYVTAGAAWRPAHTATLLEGESTQIAFETLASVWQMSGEDWTDVRVQFSTERPSLGTKPPSLQTDALSVRPRTRGTQVQTRAQRISTTGGEVSRDALEELPGVDDGGETLTLRAPHVSTIPSDGRPHLVPLHSFEVPAERDLVCTPELVPAVLTRTRQVNRGGRPLLAGPVELRRHGGYVGRSLAEFVAPDERFDLGWGPAPRLRVHRSVEQLEHTRRTLGSWTRKPRRVEIRISNLGPEPATLLVRERVMVSEVDKVKVEIDDLHRGTIDDDGIVTWTVDVKGFGQCCVQLAWSLVVHDEVQGI